MSYDVTCHMTTVMYLFINKKKERKRKIKSRKIDKKKRKSKLNIGTRTI